ncbi:kelch domain-containing protein 7A [Acinonyx jubatus]|uniref:Kelch domain-containing protein 7A n=1 Tax=Acinonyx jubatus TaxID=32536 RepID=A0A6J1ZHD5_ACIJB|nr:kelch domain-containing protein 7A [Acinonyx jubatus]
MLPGRGGAESQDWHLDMQLAGKVVLSAAALLLVTAAYRLYRLRPARAPLGDRNSKAEEKAEGSGQPADPGAVPGAPHRALRRRRGSKGAGAPLGCDQESQGGSRVPATGRSPEVAEAQEAREREKKGAGVEAGGQGLVSELVPPRCSGQEAGTAVGGKPEPPHHPTVGDEFQSSPLGLAAAEGSRVGRAPTPWRDGGPPGQPGLGERESPATSLMAHTEGERDTNRSWVFPRNRGVHGEEAGALQAAVDMGLTLHQREGAAGASYTYSSVSRVRVEENFIPEKVEGMGPRLKGKVYDYYVESTSWATSKGRLAPRTAAPAEAPLPGPLPGAAPGTEAASGGRESGAETPTSSQPRPSPPTQGFGRKESLVRIVENPELQLQLEGFGAPAPSCPDQSAPPGHPLPQASLGSSSAGSSREAHVQLVAGTNFFHLPLAPGSAPDVYLDLGNCYQVLTLAKKQKLEALKEAAYKVMSDNYLQVLRSPDIYRCLSGTERELILRRRLRGRERLVVADVCPQEGSGRLCCYDEAQDAWHPLARLPPEAVSRGCALCSLFNYLFVASGCRGPGHEPSNRVFCYNPLTGIWSEVCPLNQARPHCRLVALDGHLYAIGGECLNTVERYDPRLDRWTFAPPLPSDSFALAHTATACAGDVYVTGGTLRYLLLRFSAREQRWRAGPTGGGKDRTAEMVAVNGFLYRFDLDRRLGISVHRCSASARLWYECATYRTPYPDAFQCAPVGDLIYCVGRWRLLCFLADHISPRFVPKEPRSFPSPRGTLLPAVLTLPVPDALQTRV